MKLTAVVIDDEPNARKSLINMIDDYVSEVKVVAEAGSVDEAMIVLSKYNPDIVFMDVRLSPGNGFEILEKLNKINFEIIFTTAFDKYAINAIKFSALDYLLKPIDPEELIIAINKLRKRKKEENTSETQFEVLKENKNDESGKIVLSTSSGIDVVALEDIIYCSADNNYTIFHLINAKKIMISKTLKEYSELLNGKNFLRIHKSYLINILHIKKYHSGKGGYLEMDNGELLEIARERKSIIREFLKKIL